MGARNVFLFCVLGLGVATQATPVSEQLTAKPALLEDVLANTDSSGIQGRIVAGWPARDNQIPHQVSVRMVGIAGQVFSCGGSVIHHHWVMTAAHCVANRFSFIVRFGLTNLTLPDNIVESSRKYIHPGYWEPSAGVQTDDIALLGIDQYIEYGPTVQPCRLQPSQVMNRDYTGVVFTASGYGMTEDAWNGGAVSETLNWVYLRGITNQECFNVYGSIIGAPTICAEYYNNTAQSSCSGDSGGPLTYVDFDGRPTMVGVASFVASAGCNSPFPSGWVRPGHYHAWYREITGLNFDWSINSSGFVDHDFEAPPADALQPSLQAAEFGPLKPGFSL